MSTRQIALDQDTDAALESLAEARGTTSAELLTEIVVRYVRIHVPNDGWTPAPPDPLDELLGSVDADPVDDIDEVIYGR